MIFDQIQIKTVLESGDTDYCGAGEACLSGGPVNNRYFPQLSTLIGWFEATFNMLASSGE